MLLSSKQIYSEAIDYLYSANTFVTLYVGVMLYLPLFILPQSVNTIRTLTFYWRNLPPHILSNDSG
ncbi:uncharacterized protein K444DRAFT_713087, partial [Hyaloscypha bicolor E]